MKTLDLSASTACSTSLYRLTLLFAGTAALALTLPGCGGGGGNDEPAAGEPPPVAISGRVVDGPLQGATACYDLNDNGACDSGEPTSAATPADGSFTINVVAGVAGRHAVVVNVPATAIDADTGAAVGAPLTFVAPATNNNGAQSVFVSPLTTLVAAQMRATGATAAEAAAVVQAQAGLDISPLQDFTGTAPALQEAALLARLAVQTQIALAASMAPQLGQTSATGGTITQADIDLATVNALRAALPALAAAAADPVVAAATNVQQALVAAAADLVATQPTLDAAAALAAVAAAQLPQGAAGTAEPTATLRALSFTDANNWNYRAMAANAGDNTPDNAGLLRFYDIHRQAVGGVVSTWGLGTLQSRSGDTYWNGSLWRTCEFGFRSTQTQRDASGFATYNYCDGYEKGTSQRNVLDISGQTLASVITNRIRTFAGEDSGIAYANWGPTNLAILGSATFPAGSEIYYQTSTPTENAFAYDVNAPVTTFGTGAAAGGDARNNTTLPCFAAFNAQITAFNVGTLEQLTTVATGNPCTVNPQTDANGSSTNPNLWWGATSVSLGTVTDASVQPAGTGNFYTTSAALRVIFTGNSSVRYVSCLTRTSSGSIRNCTEVGSGTYAIQTLGTAPNIARVMTFSNLPTIAQRLNFTRIFVERDGVVYLGYRSNSNVTRSTLRLNLTAGNAVLNAVGIAPITP
jgi:hypothetical protein